MEIAERKEEETEWKEKEYVEKGGEEKEGISGRTGIE
jgi:hypothetical protein